MARRSPLFGNVEIDRPAFCVCETPWQSTDGPLKDGSHYSHCIADEVAEELDAMRSVIRRLLDGWVVDSCGKCWRHRERLVRGAMSDAERAVIDDIDAASSGEATP